MPGVWLLLLLVTLANTLAALEGLNDDVREDDWDDRDREDLEAQSRLTALERKMEEQETKIQELQTENMFLRTSSLRTCEDLKTTSYNQTGLYMLDPAGSGRPEKFYCDMERGVTEVGHDHEGSQNVTWCRGEGCFTLSLTYGVPMDQIKALVAVSETCEQEIKFECKLAPLKNSAFGTKFGWWTDNTGDKKFYFDGADETSDICDINTNGGVCNCDTSLVPLWNSDTGTVTNKGSLPIKEFHYGGFFNEHQAARVTIGKLRCSGKSESSKRLLSTCSSLKRNGQSADGFYLTKDSLGGPVSVTYCQMSVSGYREEELRLGEALSLARGKDDYIFSDWEWSMQQYDYSGGQQYSPRYWRRKN